MGATEIWSSNQISASLIAKIPILTDEDDCPDEEQPFPPPTKIFQRLIPLWKHSVHTWAQILARVPNGRPYFLDDIELQCANPVMRTPFPQPILAALTYLRALLSSTDPTHSAQLKRNIMTTPLWDLPIATRWRQILEED